ncbi:unnamed protein product [Cladocopium goreaui]|uniref:CUB and sushi domain-containing protein 1 n=1 Tax=Cladocopium goreaui TaxID=2562237 RepID=A0A9P1BJR9_9DINO|nr:unnamed protein product [Cladocopium goreaui]
MAKKKMARKTDFVSQGDTGLHSACGAQDVAKGAAGEAPEAFDVVYITSEFQSFCGRWQLRLRELGTFEDCDVDFGPTADDYLAWLSAQGPLSVWYTLKDKDRVVWSPYTHRWLHPPSDERGCSAPSAARADWWAGGLEIAESHKLEDQSEDQWIGLRENLQERPIFNRKIYGFL